MRARRSCPRSSVPNGCAAEGPFRRAVKSISLIGTFQTKGSSSTEPTIAARITTEISASRCRRNRRHASSHGENCRALVLGWAATSAVLDTGIEPSIEKICDKVEHDHQNGGDES